MSEIDTTRKNLEDGVRIKAKMKRGTGTRDQDVVTGKIKKQTAEEAEEEKEKLLELMEETMEELRGVQPDE